MDMTAQMCTADMTAPMCNVCNHHHHQGVKCGVCGHVGRCNIFPKMKARASELRRVSVCFYDPGSVQRDGDWDVVALMRNAIYCGELNIPHGEEFVQQEEAVSRHMLAFVGDAPVVCGRYRLSKGSEGQDIAVVDRFGVLPEFRGRGLGRQCLPQLIADVSAATGSSATEVVFAVPCAGSGATLHAKALAMGFRDSSVTQTRGGVTFAMLALPK